VAKDLYNQMDTILANRVEAYLANIKVSFKGFKGVDLEYQVGAPPFNSVIPDFGSGVLNQFIQENLIPLSENKDICELHTIEDIKKQHRRKLQYTDHISDQPIDYSLIVPGHEFILKYKITPALFIQS
jgi:hypothetical protein